MSADRPTFEVREAGAPTPTQLNREEISAELRALLWNVLYDTLTFTDRYGHQTVRSNRTALLKNKHVRKDHRPVDEFSSSYRFAIEPLKAEIFKARFPEFYGLIEWFLRHIKEDEFSKYVGNCLTRARAPYRVLGGDTLVPVGTDQEYATIKSAIDHAFGANLLGTASHLKAAASAASAGRWADSIRDSIHAVESAAVHLEPSAKELGPALNKLERKGLLHGGLKVGFRAIYGYTSDEKGVRHSLLENESARVDEADALFMLGACASFVSYLVAKGRLAGILES